MRESRARSVFEAVWCGHFQSIFVGRIERNFNKTQLRKVFSPFGVVVDTHISKRQGTTMGFSFVQFRRPVDSNRLLKTNLEIQIGGQVVRLDRNRKSGMPGRQFQKKSNQKLLGGIHCEESRERLHSFRMASPISTKTFKEALARRGGGEGESCINLDGSNRCSIGFSYVKASTKGQLASTIRLVRSQCEQEMQKHGGYPGALEKARASGTPIIVTLVGKTYCLFSFLNVVTRNGIMKNETSLFDERYLDISTWDFSDLASSSMTSVFLRGVLLSLWNSQFFAFLRTKFGFLLEISPATDAKLNLMVAWLKQLSQTRLRSIMKCKLSHRRVIL